jgi:methyl-accepting chemotaxis protein
MLTRKPRRRLLVDPRFQSEVISSFLAVFVPAALILGAINWAILREVEGLGQALGMPVDHAFFQRLAQLRTAATAALFVTLAGVIALVVYGGLLRTRRIAGPILAVQRQLERAAQGEGETQVHTRRGDYFAGLLLSFNRLMGEKPGEPAAGPALPQRPEPTSPPERRRA